MLCFHLLTSIVHVHLNDCLCLITLILAAFYVIGYTCYMCGLVLMFVAVACDKESIIRDKQNSHDLDNLNRDTQLNTYGR